MVYMYHSFLIHSSADGHLGCFHVLAIINSAVMNIGVHVSLSDLVSSVSMPRSGIAGSYGSSNSTHFFLDFCLCQKILTFLTNFRILLLLCCSNAAKNGHNHSTKAFINSTNVC